MHSDWPRREFRAVPTFASASELAAEIRRAFAPDGEGGPCDLARICEVGGFDIHISRFSGSSCPDGMLIPSANGRFDVLVNSDAHPRPGGGTPRTLRSGFDLAPYALTISHEIAHSFFYSRRDGVPRRLVCSSAREEAFCEWFASALLIPPGVVRDLPETPETVASLSTRYGVATHVAGFAVASVHRSSTVVSLTATCTGNRLFRKLAWVASHEEVPLNAPEARKSLTEALTHGRATERTFSVAGGNRSYFLRAARHDLTSELLLVLTRRQLQLLDSPEDADLGFAPDRVTKMRFFT